MEKSYIQELYELIHSDIDDSLLCDELENYHENDIAKVFPLLTKNERIRLYRILDQDVLSDIVSYLENPIDYLEEISTEKVADILESMDTDDAIDVLEDYEEDKRSELISLMDEEAVNDIKLIKSYEEEMIGSKMTTNYIVINKNYSVKKAMKTMIEEAKDNDNVSTLYFINDDETFFGAMELRDLILARESDVLENLIKDSYPFLYATELVDDCIGKIQDYALDSIPVLDDGNKLIGVITSDDIVEVVQEELTEDYAKFAGLSGEEDLDESLFVSIKKRIPWLLILLVLGLMVSMMISGFEDVVKVLPMIVFFQSLILDMAGNSGTQSLAVTIRILSDEKTSKKDIKKHILKEIRVGFINGLIIGVLSSIEVLIFISILEKQPIYESLRISLVVGVSLLSTMMVSSFAGSMIPVIFKKIKIDPAVASGPFITTINDLIAILIYYGMAWLLFIYAL